MSPSTKYGLCPLSVVPVRTQPSHKSEQLYQLLFGETVVVEERKGRKWLKVRFGDL
ncbi:MAG: SH3 domain-containing protein, partial [Bacteroidetes bacterium]